MFKAWVLANSPDKGKVAPTTFITPFGLHTFNRLPSGILSALDHFQHRCHRAQPLPVLQPGQNVWLPLGKMQGSLVSQSSAPRAYLIGTEHGVIQRYRVHLLLSEQVTGYWICHWILSQRIMGSPCQLQNKLKDIIM